MTKRIFLKSLILAGLLAASGMAADPNDPDHKRRAIEQQNPTPQSDAQQQRWTGIPEGENLFDYLPGDVYHDIYKQATQNDPQTAKDLTSVDARSNAIMTNGEENSLAKQAVQEKKDQDLANTIHVETVNGGSTRIVLDNTQHDHSPIKVNNRVLEILCQEYADISTLFLNSQDVTDLTPIVNLHNLYELDVRRQNLTRIPPLSQLSNLKILQFFKCTGVEDLSVLRGLNLKTLSLTYCTGKIDLAPLSFVGITYQLNLDGCTGLDNLDSLKVLKNLKQLALRNTGISGDTIRILSQALPNCVIFYGNEEGEGDYNHDFVMQNSQRL